MSNFTMKLNTANVDFDLNVGIEAIKFIENEVTSPEHYDADPMIVRSFLSAPRSIIFYFGAPIGFYDAEHPVAMGGEELMSIVANHELSEYAEAARQRLRDTLINDLNITFEFSSGNVASDIARLEAVDVGAGKGGETDIADELFLPHRPIPYDVGIPGSTRVSAGMALNAIAERSEHNDPTFSRELRDFAERHFTPTTAPIEVPRYGVDGYWLDFNQAKSMASEILDQLEHEHGPLIPIPGSFAVSSFLGASQYSVDPRTYPGRGYLITGEDGVSATEEERAERCVILDRDRVLFAWVYRRQ